MRLLYVYKDKPDNRFFEIGEYCYTNDIEYDRRAFNSYSYEEDRDYIASLPAVHVYTDNCEYYETVHLTRKEFIQDINSVLTKIKEEKKHFIEKLIAKLMSKKIISRFK